MSIAMYGTDISNDPTVTNAEAAIAKAKGKS